ncbi:MAG: DUF1800 domain-containing protein [Methanosarcinales archaeon]|nr:DUF1800 domain-containing protein [Methanosarcinales archaeon]
MPNCNTSNLGVFVPDSAQPWNKLRIQHIYRRLGFGASNAEIDTALTQTPAIFIDNLITQAIAVAPLTSPSWADMDFTDYGDPEEEIPIQHEEIYLHFENDMLTNGLRARFTLFWHNHFVTRLEDVWCPSWLVNYYQTLQTYAFGNFKDFVRTVGITPAMLVFLGGSENTATEPNENYARELYELFTLGVNNGYTQTDITNTARALTGYTGYTEYCAPITLNSDDFDSGQKTIFGQTGNWNYDDVVDILFQEKGDLIANFICTKLYAHFVSPEINETIVSQLASTFTANNFELSPVYRQLFKSNHFFDEKAIGTIVKSPFDLINGMITETITNIDNEFLGNIIWFNGEIGQLMFDPIDVAGWQENHDWINSSTLIGRWNLLEWYLYRIWDDATETLRDFAVNLAGTSTDPAEITQIIVDHLLPNGLQTNADYVIATDIFKDEVPQNYYDNNLWDLQWESATYQVFILLLHIIKLPEFQLK